MLQYLNLICDPLEQFDIFVVFETLKYAPLNFSIYFCFNLVLRSLILVFAGLSNGETSSSIYSGLTFAVKNIHQLLASRAESNIRLTKQVYLPLLLYVFLRLLVNNLIGRIPFSYTITSSFIWTFYLSLSLFLGINFLAVYQQGYTLFSFGVPTGSPRRLAPLIAVVELISYFSRVASLAIRLFANRRAGHTLLKILIGFSWIRLNASLVLVYFSILPWIIVTLVRALEVVISFLQAYVFVILISLYLNDIIILH